MTTRRKGGIARTNTAGEYRLWLSDWPSEHSRSRFLQLARESKEAQPLQIALDENTTTLTFVSSGNLKADFRVIDLLLKEASR